MFVKFQIVIFFTLVAGILSCTKDVPAFDPDMPVGERIDSLIRLMTLEEKTMLLHGNSKFTVAGIKRLGIPQWSMSDGPHGVREEVKAHVWESAGWTTDSASYFPTGTALAATWNPELAYQFGQALGREARARHKDVILGPGINILRTPLCGRNFEYMGEDPYLVSQMVVPYIRGVQDNDVAACVKHFALNNQEYERNRVNVEVDERALREIYLPGFEAAIKDGGALTVMTAYNKFRGDYCSENSYLLNDILKKEWGFRGIVMSDWNGTHSTVKTALAGLDLEMGTEGKHYKDWYFARPLLEAVEKGAIDEEVINDKVRRVLTVMFETRMFDPNRLKGSFTTPEHFQLARKVAEEAVVLLKNDQSSLPLNKSTIASIAVIGDNAARRHAYEGGSSAIKAIYEITPLEGLEKKLGSTVAIQFAQGYQRTTQFSWSDGVSDHFDPVVAEKLRDEAVQAAAQSDIAILFAGLNHDFDCEGWDRKDMKLPYEQDQLISEVVKANPKTIVVLISGSPLEMPWIDQVPAVILGWYGGMEIGHVLADILFGDVSPSGKLSFTFPQKLEDSPAHAVGDYPGENEQVRYREGIWVGYRYFDQNKIEPLFPFGHGLSYTQFDYTKLKMKSRVGITEFPLEVALTLSNTGNLDGAEVVQVYVSALQPSIQRPVQELKAFQKIHLPAGQSRKVVLTLNERAFSWYDVDSASWKIEPGRYRISVGSSSRDLRLSADLELTP